MASYAFATCRLDGSRRALTRDGKDVPISRRAFVALQFLMKSYPGAVSREELYAALWPHTFVNLTNLNNVIGEIRKALGDGAKKLITTRHGYGYVVGVPVVEEGTVRAGESRFALIIAGETILLSEGENLIGRSVDAVVLLDLPSISRHHALIRIAADRAKLEDLGSKNGTFLGDDRLSAPRELHDRDPVRFGSICGVFCHAASEATLTDPAAERLIP